MTESAASRRFRRRVRAAMQREPKECPSCGGSNVDINSGPHSEDTARGEVSWEDWKCLADGCGHEWVVWV